MIYEYAVKDPKLGRVNPEHVPTSVSVAGRQFAVRDGCFEASAAFEDALRAHGFVVRSRDHIVVSMPQAGAVTTREVEAPRPFVVPGTSLADEPREVPPDQRHPLASDPPEGEVAASLEEANADASASDEFTSMTRQQLMDAVRSAGMRINPGLTNAAIRTELRKTRAAAELR